MKSNKGITLISLIIYIIVLSVVIGTISLMMKYFYKNENETVILASTSEKYSRFIAYITDDINSGKVDAQQTNVEGTADLKITFSDGIIHEYKFENNKIYYIIGTEKKIILSKDIETCEFSYENRKITTNIKIGDITYHNNFYIK